MFQLIYSKWGEPDMYLCSESDIAGSDADINAVLKNVPIGTIIATPGFTTMKQLGFGGEWETVGGDSN